tara:strand:- start:1467 stop:1724 length:258 start_codon:yes stop_codon:yes gene_type:complete
MKYTPANLPKGFKAWWKEYPRKVAKGQAIKAWVRNDCEEIADEILKATRKYPFSDEVQYIPHPATWLNGWRWEDVHEEDSNDSDW